MTFTDTYTNRDKQYMNVEFAKQLESTLIPKDLFVLKIHNSHNILLRQLTLTDLLLTNLTVHDHPYVNLPILSNINPVSSITTHLSQIHFNIILPSMPWPP